MSDPTGRFVIALPRSFPEPFQDELSVELFSGDEPDDRDRPSIMVGITHAGTSGDFFALDPDEARALAAQLVTLADDVDAGRWPDPGQAV